MSHPDSTAVTVALWRAAHLILDKPPHVLEDHIAARMALDAHVLRGAQFPTNATASGDDVGDDWLRDARMLGMRRRWRGSIVARARFTEDLVLESGVEQYVILGAGLDSFALRHQPTEGIRVFEVDEPETQGWKRTRLKELGLAVAPHHHFSPVDFERGESWVEKIVAAGFSPGSPAVVAMLGVSQYITLGAMTGTLRLAVGLAPGSMFVATFIAPAELLDPVELEMRAATEESAAARGHPWITFYQPAHILALTRAAGFRAVRHVSPGELTTRYFAERTDGLVPSTSEHMIVATIQPWSMPSSTSRSGGIMRRWQTPPSASA